MDIIENRTKQETWENLFIKLYSTLCTSVISCEILNDVAIAIWSNKAWVSDVVETATSETETWLKFRDETETLS